MHVGEIDLPDALLDAQQRRELVIFAGAGVSVAPPSSYPQLRELAATIAEGASVRPRDGEPLDRFLGRLQDEGIEVHEKLTSLLTDPESRPSSLHFDLLRLFPSARDVRLVTTNFDTHFDTAAEKVFDEPVTIYYAPALPLGYQIDGIAYLHGSVARKPVQIVLTDGDFGRAYLTEGWARRFLQELFVTFTVLFVGYSHNDPVMNYLARGLPPEVRDVKSQSGVHRYALAPSRNHGHWEFLGIEPITYPLIDGENPHQSLANSIAEWARMSRMERHEHERRVREIAEGGPSQAEAETGYLLRALRDSSSLPVFTRHATGLEWMKWADRQGLFDPLFEAGPLDEPAMETARWFAEQLAVKQPRQALALVQRHDGMLNPSFWDVLTARLASEDGPRSTPKDLARWVAVLLHPAQQDKTPDKLIRLLDRCVEPGDEVSALLLFEYLTRPYLSLNRGMDAWKRASPWICLEGDPAEIRRSWEKVFLPRLADFASKLETILAAQIAEADLLMLASRGTGRARAHRADSPGLRFLDESYREVKAARPAAAKAA